MAIGTVLVGIDGSPNGRAALEEAIQVTVAASEVIMRSRWPVLVVPLPVRGA